MMKKIATVLASLLFAATAQGQPDSSGYWKREFSTAMEAFQLEKAVAAGKEWTESDPHDQYAKYSLASAYIRLNDIDMARDLLSKILDTDSTNVPTLNQMARIYRNSNRYRDALLIYEKLISSDSSRAYYPRMAAEMAYLTFQFEKAFAYYHQSLAIDPEDPNSLAGMAKISLDATAFNQADSLLRKGLESDSSNFTIRLLYVQSAFLQEKYELVDSLLPPEVSDVSQSVTALRYLGISLYHLGEYMRSMGVLTQLVNHNRDIHYPHYYLGLCYEAMGETEYAEVQFRQAVNKSLSPNLPVYYEKLGLTQQELGDHPKAIENLTMAKKLGGDPEIYYHLGRSFDAYYEDKDVALRSYQSYISEMQEIDSLADNGRMQHARNRIDDINRIKHFETKRD